MEKPAPSKQRLFLALDLPAETRESFVAWQHDAFSGHSRSIRLVPPEALHVTLVFLGHRAEDPIGVVAETAFRRVPRVAPDLESLGVRPVPPRRTRLWAIDLADHGGRAAAVQAAMEEALVERGLYEPEKRPFWPHITVARLRSGARAPKVEVPAPAARFTADRAVLYRSHLSPKGARYEALSTVSLGAAANG